MWGVMAVSAIVAVKRPHAAPGLFGSMQCRISRTFVLCLACQGGKGQPGNIGVRRLLGVKSAASCRYPEYTPTPCPC